MRFKRYLRRMTGLLSALVLLAGVVIPAGLLPAAAAVQDDPTVTAIDFTDPTVTSSGGSKTTWSDRYVYRQTGAVGADGDKTVYTVSFEYYLPEAATLTFSSVAGFATMTAGSTAFLPGYHTFSATFSVCNTLNALNKFAPRITNAAKDATLYIWNYSVTCDAEGFAYYDEGTAANNVATDTTKTLSEYAWARFSNPYVTEIDFTTLNPTTTGTDSKTWCDAIYRDSAYTGEDPYVVSFEYYLPSDATVVFDSVAGYLLNGTGSSRTLEQGHHIFTYSCTVDKTYRSNGLFAPRLTNAAMDAKIYIWNYSVSMNGEVLSPKADSIVAYLRAAETTDKLLQQYAWYPYMDVESYPDTPVYAFAAGDLTADILMYNTAGTSSTTSLAERNLLYDSGVQASAGSAATWILSFEYYLPEESSIYVRRAEGSYTLEDDATGSCQLQQGHHTFTCTFTSADFGGGSVTPGFGYYYDPYHFVAPSDFYIWNLSLSTADGATVKTLNASKFTGYLKSNNTVSDMYEIITMADMLGLMEDDKTRVTELDFTNVPSIDDGGASDPFAYIATYRTVNKNYTYTVSFNYYLPTANTNASVYLDSTRYTNEDGGNTILNTAPGEGKSYKLRQGRHRFEGTISGLTATSTSFQLLFKIQMNQGLDHALSKIYIWDLTLTSQTTGNIIKPADNYLLGKAWETGDGVTAADVTPTADAADMIPAADLEVLGAEYMDGYSLGFVSRIGCTGAVRGDDGAADYTAATVIVNGIQHPVVSAGTVYAWDSAMADGAPEITLRRGNTGVTDIPATTLLATDEGESGIKFAGVVSNISRDSWDSTISARPYVVYQGADGKQKVLYGDVLSCSVTEAKSATPYTEQSSRYDAQADEMRNTIVNSANGTYSGTVYYVSPNGDDSAAGTSPETAWKTLSKVNSLSGGTADARVTVLFERGGLWRGGMWMRNYTTYGAYGEGEKPRIYGSRQNYADASLWSAYSERENVWVLDVSALNTDTVTPGVSVNIVGNNVGNILFIDAMGEVAAYGEKHTADTLHHDYEFYHDIAAGKLYLYLETEGGQNPADLYDSIEVCSNTDILSAGGTRYGVTVENLCLKYTGAHGVHFGNGSGNTVRNCEIGWIGGSFMYLSGQDMSVRYGNGIEFYGSCSDITVENNWIYQCYDAGYTNQGSTAETATTHYLQKNILVQNNLIEYCCYSIEVWVGDYDSMEDCTYQNNLLRFAGYEFERDNRIGGSLEVVSHFNFFYRDRPLTDVVVQNNIMDTSYCHLLCASYPNVQGKGPMVTGNTYVQGYDRYSTVALCWDVDDTVAQPKTIYDATGQTEMEASVAVIDTAPTAVYYDG